MRNHTKRFIPLGIAAVVAMSVAVSAPANAFSLWNWLFGSMNDSRYELDVTATEPEADNVTVKKNTQVSRGNVSRTVIIRGNGQGNSASVTVFGNNRSFGR